MLRVRQEELAREEFMLSLAEDRAHVISATEAFADEFQTKWPKAVAKITEGKEALLAF